MQTTTPSVFGASGTQHPSSSRLASSLLQSRAPVQRRRLRPLTTLSVPLSLLLLLLLTQHCAALKCYICNNCIKFELSQSRPCPPEQTKCMKMNMETGQVQRSCGTESMCTDSDTELKTRYTAVSCCDDDNCNSAMRTPVPLPPIMVALLVLLLHSRPRGWGVH